MVRRSDRWQLAVAQHPMYLIIREDEEAAERIPPWGSPSIEDYISRIDRTLETITTTPTLRLGFEWSGAELELLAEDDPRVLLRIRDLAAQGRLGFYNGTYSQPHLQVLSSEANFRQFELGAEAYEAQLGVRVRTYAHQEVSVHDQVPQLLRAFGFDAAVLPGFLSSMRWLSDGLTVHHGVRGPRYLNGREFVSWQALDGTTIPLLLHQPIPRDRSFRQTLAHEQVIGSLGVPRLLIDLPDMVDIDEAWLADRSEADLVLLDATIRDRIRHAPPLGRISLTTGWSYLEGIQVEALSRTIVAAERLTLAADAIQAVARLAGVRLDGGTKQLWRGILRSQHHDAFCFSAPGLRQRALGWLDEAAHGSRDLLEAATLELAPRIQGTSSNDLIVYGTTPHPVSGFVEADVRDAVPAGAALIDSRGAAVPTEWLSAPDGQRRVRFPASLPGLGYRTFRWASGGREGPFSTSIVEGTVQIENSAYRATLGADGTFLELGGTDGPNLLAPDHGPANRLSGTDSAALSTATETDDERLRRLAASDQVRGPALVWQPTSESALIRGPLGSRFEAHGRLSDRILVDITIQFADAFPRIDIRHRFRFDRASVGTYFDDGSKLLLHWPLRSLDEAFIDIPFGMVVAPREQSIFPTSWLDARVDGWGVLLLHGGTPRHWINDTEVVRLLGWGEDTDAIGNRLGNSRWLKRFDQRLRGDHIVSSAVVVHPASWQPDALISEARSFTTGPLAMVLPVAGTGDLPRDFSAAEVRDRGLHVTSARVDGDDVVFRLYNGPNPRRVDEGSVAGPAIRSLTTPNGEQVSELSPWRIAELRVGSIEPAGRTQGG